VLNLYSATEGASLARHFGYGFTNTIGTRGQLIAVFRFTVQTTSRVDQSI
jgi:hypothetical protein